jgi:adenylate cyclase
MVELAKMAQEIERRFFVRDPSILKGVQGRPIVQGYLVKEHGAMSTRVRVSGALAWVTLKSPRVGMVREEFEYPIPVADAMQIIAQHCAGRVLHKIRHEVPYSGLIFEVDVFQGRLAGLTIAELELPSALTPVRLPDWLGVEITGVRRYGNAALAQFGLPTATRMMSMPQQRADLLESVIL